MSAIQLQLAFLLSVWGWLILLFIVLLLFGSRIPRIARGLGQTWREFRRGARGEDSERT